MFEKLSTPIRRLLALALLFAAVGTAATTVVFPLKARIDELNERIQQNRDLVSRLGGAAPQSVPETTEQTKAQTEAARLQFVAGESQSIRLTAVQAAFVQTLASSGLKPRTVRSATPRSRAGLQLVGVQLQVYATLEQVQAILTALDAHQPRLLVESMQIVPQPLQRSDGASGVRLLDVRLDGFGIEPPQRDIEAAP